MEAVPLGGSSEVAGAAVPVAAGLGTSGLGLGLDVATASLGGDDGGTGGLGHGERCSEGGDEEKDNFVEGHGLF